MHRWFIEFHRGEEKATTPMYGHSVCVCVLFPLFITWDRKEKNIFFFTIQVKFNRRELKKETWMRFYFQSAEPFTLDIVAQGLFIRCAPGLLLWRDISHLLSFSLGRNPDRKDRERKWKKKRERERDVSYHSNKSSFIELLEVAMLVGNNITLHTIKGATCLALGDVTTFIFSFFSDECQDEKSKSTAVRAFLLRHFFFRGDKQTATKW